MANANRDKGHRFERKVVNDLKDVGFDYAKTTRAESKTLDDSGIDIANVPFNIQAKSGYEKNRPNFITLRNKCILKLKENYPPENPVHENPFVLIHKTKGADITVTIDYEYFLHLISKNR
jgi:hypothetical protein